MAADLFILYGALRDGELETYGGRLAAPLRAAGLAVDFRSMADLAGLPDGAAAVPLLAWNYHFDVPAWREQLDLLARLPVKLPNSASLLAWNTDKTYLRDLAGRGAPTVPTLFRNRITSRDIEAARAEFGVDIVVVKPTISAGAKETLKLGPDDLMIGAPKGAAMLQPFLPAVGEEGEMSLFYFGGAFSHAVVKVAQAGDFRVQPHLGGRVTTLEPSEEAFAAAEAVLAAAPERPAYARVDLIRRLDGRLALMELEMIEPDLFLDHAPDGGKAFARAMRAAIGG